jgi:nucleoside-diphosphate-sugar epimerase
MPDVRHSLADVTAAQEALGYRAEVDFGEGLRRTVAWYRECALP